MKFFLLFFVIISTNTYAQFANPSGFDEDEDLNVGGDIFQDFNEDLEAAQVMEDERFYRYARFFGVNLGLGLTTFTGNRGLAYEDNHPTFAFSLQYFINFQNAVVMGIEYSKHTMFIDTYVNGSDSQILGAIETSMLRPFIGFRYYLDTSDLGTAITYSNPYFVGRFEYWYQTNVFAERQNISDQTGGALGFGVGAGLEFPIEIKKKYFNVELLYHRASFFDRATQDYRQITEYTDLGEDDAGNKLESEYGYDDLTGDVITLIFNYNISW